MFIAILNALAALPSILKYVKELVAFFEKQFGTDWEKKMLEASYAFKAANEAKTPDDYKKASVALSALFNSRL